MGMRQRATRQNLGSLEISILESPGTEISILEFPRTEISILEFPTMDSRAVYWYSKGLTLVHQIT